MDNKEAISIITQIKEIITNDNSWSDVAKVAVKEAFGLAITALEKRPQGVWLVTAEDNDGVHRICCPFCSYEKGSNNNDTVVVKFIKFPKFCESCGAELKGGAE